MAARKTVQSVEPNIADLVNGWLKSYQLDYKLEQESLNAEIDKALNDYFSKNGGAGGNRPDVKLLLMDSKLDKYPILIEYKGYKDKLIKLDADGRVENRTAKNEPNYKNIDAQNLMIEQRSVDSFICGFRLAWEMANELKRYLEERPEPEDDIGPDALA